MSDRISDEKMPNGMMARARWAAERTPENRNRAVDLYRAVAIMFVVLGHWLLVAPVIRDGEVTLTILLAEQRWTQYATWLFQVMPVFFFVGGFANSLSWASAKRDPEKARIWASTRLARLLKPSLLLVLTWAVLAFIAGRMGVNPDLINAASQAALVPVWFLAVYIMITIAVPVSAAIWDRIGFLSVVVLALGAILVDCIAFGLDQQWLRWSNYGFVWLGVHQLGYWWHKTTRPNTWAIGFIMLGLAWLYILIAKLGFPIAMVSVPGQEISNTRPPTTAMLAVGCVQIGTILLLTGPISKWLKNVRPWAWVILLNQMIMSIYLWHLTAMIAVVGIVVLLGGIGLDLEPGTGFWWSMRPIWLVLYIIVLIPLVLIFVRFEAGSRAAGENLPGPMQAMLGTLMTCGGLVMMAMNGIGADNMLGVNWVSVLLVLLGVGVATRRFKTT
jgi:hypothetical protein